MYLACQSRVIQSKSSSYAVGDLIVGRLGWRTHTIVSDSDKKTLTETVTRKLDPELHKDRESTAVGVLGMPG